ncbi:ABC transporter ATP-binding protein [Terrihabitans rhizophilus]|uniref:ABC transporter ATP-binding protein n=1 Tax=Terrihabitans rhizophilus TaxID=3092662 RepID=A0ABU4RNH1_9HYPH|nr:ABC transporter ATP-binding protein [Terrihabitans sp. PJ23]MDX6805728.1 ABC transporter ATP-binding protein [Terrihabitans sp. PJ23]
MATIKLDQLAHAYRPNPQAPSDYALRPLNLEWRDGGAYALLGPSGCGKTTLLNIISGLVRPSEGRVLFDGRDVTDVPTEQRNIAQVFQFPVVYDTMTVYENLAFPLRNRGMSRSEVDGRVREIAAMLDMSAELNRRASRLTADAKQKISLGRGLVRNDVAAVLFDEPLTVIDPALKWQLRSQLKQLQARVGRTMIYVTHDQTEAMTFADTVVVMFEGEVVQIGTPAELFARPAHTFVGYFIGSPGMNVLPARVEGDRAQVGGSTIRLAQGYPRLPDGERIEIGIRPEDLRFAASGEGLPIRISRVDDIGRIKIARARFEDHDLNLVLPEGAQVATGAGVAVPVPDRVHVYAGGHLVEGEA